MDDLARLTITVELAANARGGEVIKRVMTYTDTHYARVNFGFVSNSPDGTEYIFCPGELYLVRILATRSVEAHRPRRAVKVHDIEVVAKLTMSHEHPPAGFRVIGVWTGHFEFVMEDDDGGGISILE